MAVPKKIRNLTGEIGSGGEYCMYDIHCHLLDGLDDGAQDFEDSINMCRAAVKERVKAVVASPHFMEGMSEVSQSKIISKINILNEKLKYENIGLTVLPGMEVYICPDLVDLYEQGKVITLNNKKFMLIEFSVYGGVPAYMEDVIFNLQLKGIKPVIAHPERYRAIIKEPNIAYTLIDKGCLMQVNSGSLEGAFGRDIKKTAFTLLEHNMVHMIATDNHSIHGRMSQFRDCYRQVSKKYGKSNADDLFIYNPYKVIAGENINITEPLPIKKKWFW